MYGDIVPRGIVVFSRGGGLQPLRPRRGQALVYLILILFAAMGLAALVIDQGFVQLTQRQMQSAVDTAALEGLRQRDALSEADRRQASSDLVAMVFDDDLDPTNGDPTNLGAGPVVAFGAEPVPVTAASQTMSTSVYDPVLEPNLDDTVSGDMVAGTFQRNAASHVEGNDYSRADFRPGDGDVSFLVRMRRTDEDFSQLSGSHSAGPTLPVIFGRGSLIDRDLLARGTLVRATAIADARNVLSVGFADNSQSPELPGLATFALDLDYWNGLVNDGPDSQPLTGGEIGSDAEGRFFAITSSSVDMPVVVGRLLPPATPPIDGTYTGYVPVYSSVEGGADPTERVVGYGRAEAVVGSGMVEITRLSSEVAAENGAANLLYPLTLSSVELANVFAANDNLAESLLAPVSAR